MRRVWLRVGGSWSMSVGSGGWRDGDLVAHGWQVVNQPPFPGVGIVVAGEVVRAQVAVLSTVVQDMPDDHDEGVRDRDGGLPAARLTEPAVHAAELGADVGAGAAGGPGALGEDGADLDIAFAGPAGLVFPRGFVVTGTQPSPRGQVRGGWEPGHVDADRGDDHLRGPLTDARDAPQQPQRLGERVDDFLDPVCGGGSCCTRGTPRHPGRRRSCSYV